MLVNIAIIPARGGSKRVPGKNIKDFCGRPMISYAINKALESCLFDHVIVSTDDERIAAIARQQGASTPFIRPLSLSDDHTATVPVIAHGIRECRNLGWEIDKVCCIYPTAPFLQTEDLKHSLKYLGDSTDNYCFPITQFPFAMQRALQISNSGEVNPLYPTYENVRTQDLELIYFDAGQFYWGAAEVWLKNLKIHTNGLGYRIPSWRVVDIDTTEDWHRAESMYRGMLSSGILKP